MKLSQQIGERIDGEVFESKSALEYFATDGSIFYLEPQLVVYPRSTNDVSGVVQVLAQSPDKVGLTARGKGTDQSGGALGDGVMMVFPAHLNKLKKFEKGEVTVQPGMLYATLQKILQSHGRFLPPYPSSIDFSTIGGAIANNACGEKTVKYGATRNFIKSLKVVLANGEQITTSRLSEHQLNQKKGQTNFEGQIYRQLDALLTDNAALIKDARPGVSKSSAGYALWDIKGEDGSFDLGQLIAGSQGTLGIITEATLYTSAYNPNPALLVGYFDDLRSAGEAILKLEKLKPSALEIVDEHLLSFLRKNKPAELKGLIPDKLPKIVLLVEFDDISQLRQNIKVRQAAAILKKLTSAYQQTKDIKEQSRLWQIRHSAAAVIWMTHGSKKALPMIEDGVVPIAKLPEFLEGVYALFKKYKLEIAVWGHAGDANLHMQPFLDLSSKADRAKVFEIMDDFYDMVIGLGGSTCGEHNDGLLRAPYLKKLFGKEVYSLFKEVKKIMDPQGILNPRIKLDVERDQLPGLLRQEYSMPHLYDHMPHL
jgi:FAD/FMN-containing dehydrogenase